MALKETLKAGLKRGLAGLLRRDRRAWWLAAQATAAPLALGRIAARGLEVGSIIDVGASDGRWVAAAHRYWPHARVHLVEANAIHQPALEALCRERPACTYSLVAAGPADGEVAFDASDPFGGRADPNDGWSHGCVPQRSLASLAREHDLPPPYLIKLDTHGYEVPILDGAEALFRDACLFVIEAYTFPLQGTGPRFWELCSYMAVRGFAPIDLAEPMWRPRDGALWQFDLFFVRADRPEFTRPTYD